MRRYAENTSVPIEDSRMELETLLRRHGAANALTAHCDQPAGALVHFVLNGLLVRYALTYPDDPARTPNQRAMDRRRVWRVLILWAKARLEAVADGDSSVEAEFLSWVSLPDGRTVGEWMQPQIAAASASGALPAATSVPLLVEVTRPVR